MELLSNNSLPTQMASATSNTSATNANQNNQATAERLLAGILDSFPAWDLNGGIMGSNPRNE